MTKQRPDIDMKIVAEIDRLLTGASTDTKAEIAARALPGRIRAFSPHFAALSPTTQQRLAESTATMMQGRGDVVSATGITAAIAINWCEAQGRDYTVARRGEKYTVMVEASR
jgi:hypothetical protein